MFDIILRIGAITRLIQIESNQYFKDQRLNNNLFIYIIRVVEQPGMFLGELADSMQIDRTTSFRTVKKLTEMGYLRLANDQDNLKIKRVYPTKRGERIYPELHAFEQRKSDQLLADLSPAEREQLNQLLNKLKV